MNIAKDVKMMYFSSMENAKSLVRALMIAKGETYQSLVEKSGLSLATVQSSTVDKINNCKLKTLFKLADALEVSFKDLIHVDEERKTKISMPEFKAQILDMIKNIGLRIDGDPDVMFPGLGDLSEEKRKELFNALLDIVKILD